MAPILKEPNESISIPWHIERMMLQKLTYSSCINQQHLCIDYTTKIGYWFFNVICVCMMSCSHRKTKTFSPLRHTSIEKASPRILFASQCFFNTCHKQKPAAGTPAIISEIVIWKPVQRKRQKAFLLNYLQKRTVLTRLTSDRNKASHVTHTLKKRNFDCKGALCELFREKLFQIW